MCGVFLYSVSIFFEKKPFFHFLLKLLSCCCSNATQTDCVTSFFLFFSLLLFLCKTAKEKNANKSNNIEQHRIRWCEEIQCMREWISVWLLNICDVCALLLAHRIIKHICNKCVMFSCLSSEYINIQENGAFNWWLWWWCFCLIIATNKKTTTNPTSNNHVQQNFSPLMPFFSYSSCHILWVQRPCFFSLQMNMHWLNGFYRLLQRKKQKKKKSISLNNALWRCGI